MGEESFDDVCANITACLASSKRQVSVSELNKDYHSVLGEYIPYRKCGFNTLEDLIRAVPKVKVSRIGNETFIDVKPDEKTAHITNLVRGQKTAKKKSKGKYGTYRKPAPSRRPFENRNSSYSSHGQFSKNGFSNYSGGDFRTSKSSSSKNNSSNNRSQPTKNSHDWDQPSETDYLSKYRSSKRTELDFSDGDHDDFLDYDDLEYPDQLDATSPTKSDDPPLLDKMHNLHVTLDGGRQVSDRKSNETLPNKYRSKLNSQEDDVGYSSMNEVSSLSHDLASSERSLHEISVPRKMKSSNTNQLRGPAAIVAAGRALKEPDHDRRRGVARVDSLVSPGSDPQPSLATVDDLFNSEVFKQINRQPENITNNKMDTNPFFTSSSPKKSAKPFTSKMSDPNMFKPGPDTPPNYAESTFCGKLLMFTTSHKLPCPHFMNFTKFDVKTNKAQYMCKIKIGEQLNFSTCPFSSNRLTEAQEHVAEKAFQELCQRYQIDTAVFRTSKSKELIISRVTEIVIPHQAGLKIEALESEYKEMFKENLPTDWLYIIKEFSLLSVEELVGGIFVYPPENEQISPKITKIPPLVLPVQDEWPIFVTCCLSTNSIYFRIIMEEYNGVYVNIAEQMDEIYSSKVNELQPVDVIVEGNYYVAYIHDEWFRVKALSGILNGSVRMSLIDHGDTDNVPQNVIYPIDERLTHDPAQAVRCGLSELEQYHADCYVTSLVYHLTYGKRLMARVDSRNPHLLLTLYDTSGDVDVNLNDLVQDRVDKELTPPKIPAKNNVTDVYLTSVQEDGHAYVQIVSECFKFLKGLMEDVKEKLSENEEEFVMKEVNELVGGTVFLAKYDGDNKWHRAVVRSLMSDNQVEVVFVDYGNIEIVPLNHIASIDHFTDVLAFIPFQAIEVQLIKPNNELFTQKIIEFLMSCSEPDDEEGLSKRFLMKVVRDDPVPDVELFVRMPDNNELVSVNDIIGMCYEEYRGPNFKHIALSPAMEDKLFMPINPASIPPFGSSFNVFVSMVSNPSHFIVEPIEYRKKFEILAADMKRYYSLEKPITDVSVIKEGKAFAVERPDGRWCRGVVTLVMTDLNSVSVKCVDFGDTLSVDYRSLHRLLPCFREIPALAIKAELAGVKPVHRDWNMNDCIRFKDLVANKMFVGVNVGMNGDTVSLLLLDTTTYPDQEIDIGVILVSEGRALDITSC